MKTLNKKTKVMVECSLLTALTIILSFVKIYQAPLGGSVTLLSMLPLMIISIRHGLGWGLGSAFVFSVLKLILGIGEGNFTYVPTLWGIVAVLFLDYLFAYTAIGLAGAFRKVKLLKNENANLTLTSYCGVLLACVVRFMCHFVNGAVVWHEITKNLGWNEYAGKVGMWLYSFVYNISYLGPETLITLMAVPLMIFLMNVMKKRA